MTKSPSPRHSLILNLVFAVCLTGSILFAVASEFKAQNAHCQAMSVAKPSVEQVVLPTAG